MSFLDDYNKRMQEEHQKDEIQKQIEKETKEWGKLGVDYNDEFRIHVYAPTGKLKEIIDGALPLIKWTHSAVVVKGPDGKSYINRKKFFSNQRVNNAVLILLFSYKESEGDSTVVYKMLLLSDGRFVILLNPSTDYIGNWYLGTDVTKKQSYTKDYDFIKEKILDFIVEQKKK